MFQTPPGRAVILRLVSFGHHSSARGVCGTLTRRATAVVMTEADHCSLVFLRLSRPSTSRCIVSTVSHSWVAEWI
jgi:hypothetical protein